MEDVIIIENNTGNDLYLQSQREFLTNPIISDLMLVILDKASQINNTIKIRNDKSVGSQSNRDISLQNFISAMDKTNLIIKVPLNPPLILDGMTSFRTTIEANSEIKIMFYYDQAEVSDMFKK